MEDLTLESEDSRVLINKHLKENGIMQSWVASKIGISRSHLLNILTQKRTLSEKNKQKINETLKTNF